MGKEWGGSVGTAALGRDHKKIRTQVATKGGARRATRTGVSFQPHPWELCAYQDGTYNATGGQYRSAPLGTPKSKVEEREES